MRPGWKTTEFWTTLAAVLVPILLPGVSPDVAVAVIGGLIAIYTAARAAVKRS